MANLAQLSAGGLQATLRTEPADLAVQVHEHGALLVPDLHLDDPVEDLRVIGSAFGEAVWYTETGPVIELTNRPEIPVEQRNRAVEWHQDDIHTPEPAAFTLLYAVEAPNSPPPTEFADLRSAWASLPADERDGLRPLRVDHDPIGGAVAMAAERRGRVGHTARPGLTHPLVLRHPVTHTEQLFGISGTAAGITGWPVDVGVALLRTLKTHALRSEHRFSGALSTHGLLVWDNLALMHAATPVTYSAADGLRRTILRLSTRRPRVGEATADNHGGPPRSAADLGER